MYNKFQIPPKKKRNKWHSELLTCSWHLFVTKGSIQNTHVRRPHVERLHYGVAGDTFPHLFKQENPNTHSFISALNALKTVHNLSLIQNNIKITSIATCFGFTCSSSRDIRPTKKNMPTKGAQIWTLQKEVKEGRRESFILKTNTF
jgi:hypothetical protein